jgi:hypothetical protein
MKRKVKRYDEGGVLTDRYGNEVKSGSGETVKTRYGSAKEDRPTSSGVEDYATMGKRAGAVSPFSGAPNIKEESTTETATPSKSRSETIEEETVAGKGAKNLALEPDVEVKKRTVVKKKAAKPYEDTGANIGSQGSFKIDQQKDTSRGLRFAPGSIAEKIANKVSGALDRSQQVGANAMKESARQSRVDRIRRNVGSNLETYGMKKGGKVSTASSRGDGIAQRGKTKGRIC